MTTSKNSTKEWFDHDYGTRNKKKMAVLLFKEKARGYGLFWIIVEMLYESRDKALDIDDSTYIAIKKESGEDVEQIKEFIQKCLLDYKVFKKVGKNKFSTERVIDNAEKRKRISQQNSQKGKKSSELRRYKSTTVEQQLNSSQQPVNSQSTEKSRVEKSREEESDSTHANPELFKLADCLTVAMRDEAWVRRNSTNHQEMFQFNEFLLAQGTEKKNPADYKRHFFHWKQKGGLNNLPTIEGQKKMVL